MQASPVQPFSGEPPEHLPLEVKERLMFGDITPRKVGRSDQGETHIIELTKSRSLVHC